MSRKYRDLEEINQLDNNDELMVNDTSDTSKPIKKSKISKLKTWLLSGHNDGLIGKVGNDIDTTTRTLSDFNKLTDEFDFTQTKPQYTGVINDDSLVPDKLKNKDNLEDNKVLYKEGEDFKTTDFNKTKLERLMANVTDDESLSQPNSIRLILTSDTQFRNTDGDRTKALNLVKNGDNSDKEPNVNSSDYTVVLGVPTGRLLNSDNFKLTESTIGQPDNATDFTNLDTDYTLYTTGDGFDVYLATGQTIATRRIYTFEMRGVVELHLPQLQATDDGTDAQVEAQLESLRDKTHDLDVQSDVATGFANVNQDGSEGGIAPAQSLIYNIADIPSITWSFRQLYGGTDTHMLVRIPIGKTPLGYRIQFSPDVSHVGALNVALSSFPILTTDENYEYRLLKGKSEHTEAFLQIASNIDTLGKTVFHGSLKNALLTSDNAGLHLGISQNNGESYSIHNPTLSDRGDWSGTEYYSFGAIVKHNHKHYLLNKLSTIATAIRHSDSPSEPGTAAGTTAGWVEWNSATTDIGIINSLENNIHGSDNQIAIHRVDDELDIGFDPNFINRLSDLTTKTGSISIHASNAYARISNNSIAGWVSASKFNKSVINLAEARTVTGWQNSKTVGTSSNANVIRIAKTIPSNEIRVNYDDGDTSDPHYATLNRGDTTHFLYVGEDTTWNYWLLFTRFRSMEFEVQRNEGLLTQWDGEYNKRQLYDILKEIFPTRSHDDTNMTIT